MIEKLPYTRYFKNLDGLRFLAALAVIIGHSQAVIWHKQKIAVFEPFANKLASFGVDFFYVLSGFLISYLLMQEIDKTGTIQIKKFYMRRFLRIWPLYFLVGIVSLSTGYYWVKYFHYLELHNGKYIDYVYNWADYFKNLFYLCTFSINFQTLLGHQDPISSLMISHFWSLAVEEQFYIIWAPMVYIFRKNVWVVILLFTGLGLFFNQLPFKYVAQYSNFHYNFTINRFLLFGLGAALAWIAQYFSWEKIGKTLLVFLEKIKIPPSRPLASSRLGVTVFSIISNRYLGILIVLGIQLFLLFPALKYLFGPYFYGDEERLYNALVSMIIIASAIADYSALTILFLENKVFKHLGKISYGIYIFHVFSVWFTYQLLENVLDIKSDMFYILCPIVATIIAVALSSISYEFFEKRFLAMKHKFTTATNCTNFH
jgi:peptidoglycan/LPS O-acetylase OafA/YrhL